MKYIEDLLIYLLEFVGIEIAKLALGDLFAALVVAFVGWFVISYIFIAPVRFIIKSENKPSPTVEIVENILVALAFFVFFGGCLYLWSIGF